MKKLQSRRWSVICAVVVMVVCTCAPGTQAEAAGRGLQLPSSYLTEVNGVRCGYVNNKWIPGKLLKSALFSPWSQEIKLLAKKIRAAQGSSATKLRKQLKALRARNKAQALVCSTVTTPPPTSTTPTVTPTVTPAPETTPRPDAQQIAWAATSVTLFGDNPNTRIGAEAVYYCPAGGTLYSVWGTDYYTADSSICSAATHAGLASVAGGGNVKIRLVTGQSRYIGSLRNSVTTNFFGTYDTALVFLNFGTNQPIISTAVPAIPWSQSASPLRAYLGETFTFICPSDGTTGSIWGTNVYTDDSSICTAAVHAGIIGRTAGGTITARILAGQSSYEGSTQNGVTSSSYTAFDGIFRFD